MENTDSNNGANSPLASDVVETETNSALSGAPSDSILRLVQENQERWEADLDALGFAEGFKDRLSQCVNNLDEFFGLTPREALQQGWYDYAEDDESEEGEQ